MPIVEVYTPHQAPSVEVCQQMLVDLASDLGAPPENTVLHWRKTQSGDRVQRKGEEVEAPFVRLSCRRCYGEERIGYSLERLVRHLANLLKVPPEKIIGLVDRKESGEIFINDVLYKEKSSVQNDITIRAIGTVLAKRSTPEDDYWGDTVSWIEIRPEFVEKNALRGLEDFSHLEVLYQFNQVPETDIVPGSRHPRGNKDYPEVGIFAQRGKDRPNRLGISRCEILKIEKNRIMVRGLDAIDGTPVIDIKPYMQEFGPRGEVRQPDWSREVMKNYYKSELDK